VVDHEETILIGNEWQNCCGEMLSATFCHSTEL
jgi:hypothetical protein